MFVFNLFYHNCAFISRYSVIDKTKSPVLQGNSNVLQKLRDSRLSSVNTCGNI
jgi:hypothetical protein